MSSKSTQCSPADADPEIDPIRVELLSTEMPIHQIAKGGDEEIRIMRRKSGGRIELQTTAPLWKTAGFGTLDPRIDARLRVDPGLIVKLEGSRIEGEFGSQLIAEGRPAADESAPALT